MKAILILEENDRVLDRRKIEHFERLELGPSKEGSLPLPGCPPGVTFGVLEAKGGHVWIRNTHPRDPILVFGSLKKAHTREAGQVALGPGEMHELRYGDTVSFGTLPGRLKCGFETDEFDKLEAAEPGKGYAPASAWGSGDLPGLGEKLKAVKGDVAKARRDVVRVGGKTRALGRNLGVLLTVGLLAGGGVYLAGSRRTERLEEDLRGRVLALASTLADQKASYAESARALEEARTDYQKELASLENEFARLGADREANRIRLAELNEEIEGCKVDLKKNRPVELQFAELQREIDAGLYWIVCTVTTDKPVGELPERTPSTSISWTGTGFLVAGTSRIVTCKHVVQPQKFPECSALLARAQAQVVSISYAALPVGHRLQGGARAPFTSWDKTLTLERWGRDSLAPVDVPGKAGPTRCWVETNFLSDLGILRVQGPTPKGLRLATNAEFESIRKGHPVMLCGFPLGMNLFESGKVESSFTIGTVRKREVFLQHTAPTCSGNSGGPLVDLEGRVVGIISYMKTGEGVQHVNVCVPVPEARKLLEP
ncbi:MAG TPA: trypsin-like peptidase domain-containing protein [Planctomycetota bacterium]|nr:trypsin-like peptidase domain-containing protein [Planctomycetota bacterium]